MPWSEEQQEYWLSGVASADRTMSGGGVQSYAALRPIKVTASMEDDFFGPNIEALVKDFNHRFRMKKGGEKSWGMIVTALDECYTGEKKLSISNGVSMKVRPRDTPLSHEEALLLCDDYGWGLPRLRSNAHIRPEQIRQILAYLTWNRRA